MRMQITSRIVFAVLVSGVGILSVPSEAQQFKPKSFTSQVQKQYVRETEEGAYKIRIKWRLARASKDLKIVSVEETPSGKVRIFRDRSKGLNINARMVSPKTLEFRLNKLPLTVNVSHPPFTIVGTGVNVVGGRGTDSHLIEMGTRAYSKGDNQSLVVFDSVFTQTIPDPKGTEQSTGDEEGEATVTYHCETCPSNPCVLGLD